MNKPVLIGRYTRHEHGFTRLVLRYADGRRETAWFDRHGKRWSSEIPLDKVSKPDTVRL